MEILTKIRVFNERVAVWGVKNFGTMFCFWICFLYGFLTLVPFLTSYQNALLYWASWVQLWALPLLMVGNIILSKESQERSDQDHETLMAEFKEIKEVHAELQQLLEEIKQSQEKTV